MMLNRRQLIQVTATVLVAGGVFRRLGDTRAADPVQTWPLELELGSFCIRCDFELPSKDSLVNELQTISGDVARLLRVPLPSDVIYVVLFKTDAEYQRYMQNYFPALPRRRAMFLQNRGPGMLFTHWHENVATDLRHEVTHALLNDGRPPLPLWLDEGLAEYFEVKQQVRFADHPYCAKVTRLAQAGNIKPLNQLANRTEIADFSDEDYQHSWAWVHFMIHRHADTREMLIRYLQEHRSGQTPFDLERGLRQIVPNTEQELERHFRALA